ncbi:hypothetical protein Tco_0052136 [Tanacetum coccineum]
MRVRLWIQQRHELPCASRKFQGIGCAMIGGEGDGVSNWTSSGVFGERGDVDDVGDLGIQTSRSPTSTLEILIEDIQVRHRSDMKSLLDMIHELKNHKGGPPDY